MVTTFVIYPNTIMNLESKSKAELIKELQELKEENNFLRASNKTEIIEHNRKELALKEELEAFRSIIEKNSEAILIIEPDGIVSMVNDAFCRENGYTLQQVIGKSWTRLIPASDLEQIVEYRQKRFINPSDVPDSYEIKFYRSNGEVRNALMSITMLSNQKIVALIIDISERKRSEKKLQESEQRYRTLFDQANEGLILLTMDGKIAELNQSFAQMHGYTVAEMKNMDIKDLDVLGDRAFDERAAVMQRIFNGEVVRFEVEHFHKKGHSFFLKDTVSLITVADQQYFLAFHQDLTENKATEEKIRVKDIQFRKLSANVPDLIFQFTRKPDGSYCVPIASEGIWNIFGCAPEDVLHDFEPIAKVIYPDDAARVISDIEYSAEHLTYFTCEFRVQIPGKPIQWIYSRSAPEKLADGSIAWYGFNVDITEKKRIELDLIKIKEKAVEREAQFRLIFESSLDAIIWTEAKTGIIIACNPASQILTEYTKQEIIGQSFTIILPSERSENIVFDYSQHQQIGGTKSLEFQILTKSGKIKYVELSGTNVEISGTEISQGIFKDISSRKQKELELMLAKEHAEESDRLKSAFLANMSHEIRTPMNGILGFANLLNDSKLSGEEQQEYIKIIEKSGVRMLNIINDIIDISKIESGLTKVNVGDSNVNDQIEYLYTFFKPEVEHKGMQLIFKNSLLSKESIIQTDREKVFAILTNLIKNAIKYSDTGTIEFGYTLVETKHASSLLEFFVKDHGIGIPKDRQEAIFERFIQADISDKRAFQGAGLGLAITKSYVEMLGGKIWVESEEGKGSTFYFTLPCNFKMEEEVIAEKYESATYMDVQDEKLTILIAEDDDISKKLIYIALKTIGKEVFNVRTGIEAVEACRSNPDIDLVLMDIQMPKMDGYEATRIIRQFNKDIIIIAQTAFGLSGDREKSIEAGCNDYISKPINFVALKGLIEKYFNN